MRLLVNKNASGTGSSSGLAGLERRGRGKLMHLRRNEVNITRPLHVMAHARLHVGVHDVRRDAADLDQPVMLNKNRVTGQIAVHDRRLARVQIAIVR